MSPYVGGKGRFHGTSFQLPSSHLSLYSIAFRQVEAPICSSRVPRPPILHDLIAISRYRLRMSRVPLTANIDDPIPHYQTVCFNRPLVSLSTPLQHLLSPTPPVDFLACHNIVGSVSRGD
ncbi:hypothetical protein XPA_010752 [Xanthoria parietina]